MELRVPDDRLQVQSYRKRGQAGPAALGAEGQII
jgi:hypothetical protein